MDAYYGFDERLWSANRKFALSLFEIASAFGKGLSESSRRATSRS